MLEVFAIVVWVGWVATLFYDRRRARVRPLSTDVPASVETAPEIPVQPGGRTSRRALLLNSDGILESVRTLEQGPVAELPTAAGTYRLDRTAAGDHWVYRR